MTVGRLAVMLALSFTLLPKKVVLPLTELIVTAGRITLLPEEVGALILVSPVALRILSASASV